MNIMQQILNEKETGAGARKCGCTAQGAARARRAGIIVTVTGAPPGGKGQYGPGGGFTGRRGTTNTSGTPPEIRGGKSSSPLIKVERKPVNLMDEILAEMRKR